jgi:ribosomal protein S18 acetylase RimI-like enzyme
MVCRDWRTSAPAEIAPLLSAEIQAWQHELDWDVTEAWRVVEPARRAGTLPGFLARDAGGRIVGWTAFLLHHGAVQVLAFVAPGPEAATALVDAILRSPDAAGADSCLFCVRAASERLPAVLADRGFDIEPYRYLRFDLAGLGGPEPGAGESIQPWRGHTEAMAYLCARAYAGTTDVRAFAPNGTLAEWIDYIAGLEAGPGCGRFAPDASFVVPAAGGRDLDAAILVTTLGPGTVHVAQIAVDPGARGRGLGRRLVQAAGRAARARGCTRMTLLVSAANRPAAAMYERLGFVDRAAFVVAVRRQPILSTRVALATGGESTRR